MRTPPTAFSKNLLTDLANKMVRKVVTRRATRTWRNLPEAAQGAITVSGAVTSAPVIDKCILIQEGHFTHVMLNDTVFAFAKFNPNDIKYRQLKRKQGSRRGTVGNKVPVTKFSSEAGVNLAIHRAVNKLLEPFSS